MSESPVLCVWCREPAVTRDPDLCERVDCLRRERLWRTSKGNRVPDAAIYVLAALIIIVALVWVLLVGYSHAEVLW
jgi:hypothetical protein